MNKTFAYIVLSTLLCVGCYSGNFGQWIPGRSKPSPEEPIPVEDFTPEELWVKILEGYYPGCMVEVPAGTEVKWMDTNIFRVYELPGCSLVVFPKAPNNKHFGFTAIAKHLDKSRMGHDVLNADGNETLPNYVYSPDMAKITIGGVSLGMRRLDVEKPLTFNALEYESGRAVPPRHIYLLARLKDKTAEWLPTRTRDLEIYFWFGNERVACIKAFTETRLNLAYYLPGPDSQPALSNGTFVSNLEQLKNNLPAKSPSPSPSPPPPSPSPPKPGPTSSPTPSPENKTPSAEKPG